MQSRFKKNIFGYAKNTTSEGPRSILRPLYNRYFCHITIKKWSQICTRTIRNGFFKDILFLSSFPIVIPIVNLIMLKFFVADLCTKRHNKNCQPRCLDVFDKNWYALAYTQPFQYCSFARWTLSIWPIQLKEPKKHFLRNLLKKAQKWLVPAVTRCHSNW